ncbi:AAA domain-containing protein [Bacillus infantis]|uniref:AAA family ATPase n=1 Tax=Bacillus infantis TaxID=324767 RepID=A0A5D4R4X4_9BACI|nr:AAA domain-containing protein [Bacillus infantis]TYS45620.1 AAA family ATPase [Bacillus infantis]
MSSSTLERDKTSRLFTYLKELSLLKAPLIRDIQNYEDYIFLNEIPDELSCISPLSTDVTDIWIEIKKPLKPNFPLPPNSIENWLSPYFQNNDIKKEPSLVERITNPEYIENDAGEASEPEKESPYLYLKDFPQILNTFKYYKTGKWEPWREEFIRFEKVQSIYTKLFSLYQKQKKLGEQYELMIGVGLLNWKTPDNQLAHRHVLTIPCSFQFNANDGIIRVSPPPVGTKTELEQDMLELEMRLDNKALVSIKEKIEDLDTSFWDKELLDSICRSFAFSLSANGTYKENELSNKRDTTTEPDILFSPALILRKRNEKGFQQACTKIIESVKGLENHIPEGIKRIFEEIDDYQELENLSKDAAKNSIKADSTIYFPLEANDEQRKIIANLETRNGVLVQGPPGTGKSHTIANLISHLLSSGKRVLITSETARALGVLKDKIPDALQDLCVSLLGADSKSFKDLEKVVQIISNKRDTWDQERAINEITQLSNNLKNMKESRASIQQQLRSIREKDTYNHNFLNGAYKGTAQTIAKSINADSGKYNWFKDNLEMDTVCPLSKQECFELIDLLELLNDQVQEQIQYSIPSLDVLDAPDLFKQNSIREETILRELEKFKKPEKERTDQFKHISVEKRKDLNNLLRDLAKVLKEVNRKDEDWLQSALLDLHQARFRPWEDFHSQIIGSIEMIRPLAINHNLKEITGAEDIPPSQLLSDATQLHAHFKEGKGLGMPLLRPKVVKDAWYIVKDVRIDGQKCDSLESISLLEETVKTDQTLRKIEQVIQDQLKVELNPIQSRSLSLARIEDIMAPFNLLLSIKRKTDTIQEEYNEVPFIIESPLNEQHVSTLLDFLESISLNEELKQIKKHFQQFIERIEKSVDVSEKHTLVDDLVEAAILRNTERYSEYHTKLIELDDYGRKSRRCEDLLHRLRAVLPKLYSDLVETFKVHTWTERFNHLENAVDWAKVNTWLTQFSQTSDKELSGQLDDLDNRIKETITNLGAIKAWFSTLSTMTEGQRQHLLAWTTSMRKVGKGTGKNAHIHLKDAQKHMSECRDAIPAWIMPLYRVFDTFDMEPNLFDVVIIDEASQSGPDAVILQYIAKKLIVVGDDKQISPEYVGMKREDVQYLRKQYLSDFKLADMLDIENSFFDLANVLFGGRITLREHFRCMPEIIEFSNRVSYSNTPLMPLRQYPPNRLEPIKNVHVPKGFREGSGSKVMNRPEAEALVAQVKACIENPLYKGKSMGVISLQNEGQGQLIERLLVEEIGTEEIEKRNIICGDAYAFQGDERDIMFLSMVAAPGQTAMRAVTTEKDKRRFNVAVSRAKDQLWLFHTPTLNDFRNKDCLRYQLISYCENPDKKILESNRALCESDFERSVFDQITAKGYKVIPQHEVAGYRIDMVIEGEKGRIAVECDGDEWHGPDRYDYDMNRQRILERCGWKFWRVRGSDYYYNPEKAISPLWDTLKYYEIEPIGTQAKNMDSKPQLVSNHMEDTETNNQMSVTNKIQFTFDELVDPKTPERNEQGFEPVLLMPKPDFEQENVHKILSSIETENKLDITQKLTSPKNGIKEFLESKGLEVIDKRNKGGALWVLGGQELSPLIEELRKDNIVFTFAYNGSKSTDKRPSWYTSYLE